MKIEEILGSDENQKSLSKKYMQDLIDDWMKGSLFYDFFKVCTKKREGY